MGHRTLSLARDAFRKSRRFAIALSGVLVCGFIFAEPARASGDLVLIPDPQLLVIMLVGFAILIFPLNVLLFKPVFAALDARANRIEGARKRSGQLDRDADSVLESYEAAIREARV